jgi:hypothetical protein
LEVSCHENDKVGGNIAGLGTAEFLDVSILKK